MPTNPRGNIPSPVLKHAHRVEPISIQRYAAITEAIGSLSLRYSFVLVLVAIGAMKFTAYESEAISGFVSHSPLLSWTYGLLSVRSLGAVIGVIELVIAVLIAVRPWSPRVSAVGSLLAIGMFATTLSFLFTTPGVVEPSLGFPSLSVVPGQFLAKDVVLMSVAIWTFGDSLKTAGR